MSNSRNNGLCVKELEVEYRSGELALGKVSFTLPEHGIYTILGPSGSGKSTLLRAITGLMPEYRGELLFNGSSLREQKVLMGLVPQNYGLLPWKTVKGNIRVAMSIAHPREQSKQAREAQIDQWLTAMGIAELAERYPLSLSGGQQQRVAIARAFAIAPSMLLLDEPFSALDAITRETLQQLFLEHWQANPATALFVTHDVDEAILLGQKMIVLPSSKNDPAEIIDNEEVFALKLEEKRASDAFFAQIKKVRKVMQEKW
ncbi:ABC transporter ATP-binding protein [Paenibacillus antibioticophila]|uniref:ABC transporter ATP-binding protein n=1 Tax=Paenibacillus antibioticophila TaxID=1274374 RepID=A0A919XRC3_9BACL|nr:ATP-binding cassette domain-containing protein [Paenibacillus antibioticophila]GIO36539.1 ABC transporter ATP-binding protein [Paenibacillus antibioticophila]